MIQLTIVNFAKSIAIGVTVVDFMTPSCQPCKPVGVLMERLSKEYLQVSLLLWTVIKMDNWRNAMVSIVCLHWCSLVQDNQLCIYVVVIVVR